MLKRRIGRLLTSLISLTLLFFVVACVGSSSDLADEEAYFGPVGGQHADVGGGIMGSTTDDLNIAPCVDEENCMEKEEKDSGLKLSYKRINLSGSDRPYKVLMNGEEEEEMICGSNVTYTPTWTMDRDTKLIEGKIASTGAAIQEEQLFPLFINLGRDALEGHPCSVSQFKDDFLPLPDQKFPFQVITANAKENFDLSFNLNAGMGDVIAVVVSKISIAPTSGTFSDEEDLEKFLDREGIYWIGVFRATNPPPSPHSGSEPPGERSPSNSPPQ